MNMHEEQTRVDLEPCDDLDLNKGSFQLSVKAGS